MRLDDTWFIGDRGRLLRPCASPDGERRKHSHLVHGILEGSRLSGKVQEHTEQALRHLAPRHRGAVRAHMQLYRAALEIIGFLPSDGIVNSAVQIEWLWYSTPFKAFYRDHLAHVMKVARTGLALLEDKDSPFAEGGVLLVDRTARKLAAGEWGTETLRTAARRCGNWKLDEPFWSAALTETVRIAGLLHDLAYADVMAVKVDRAARPVRPRAPFEPGLDDTCRHAGGLIQHHLLASPFHQSRLPGPDGLLPEARAIAAEVFRESHSLRAGYSLLRILEEAKRVGAVTPFDVFVMEWAALAASMHDYDKFYKDKDLTKDTREWLDGNPPNRPHIRPDFERDPATFIVTLADQLQDFGRMSYDVQSADKDFASSRLCYPCVAVSIEMKDGGVLDIAFILGSGEDEPCAAPSSPEMVAEIARGKHREAAFHAANDRTEWLNPRSLYTSAELSVVHKGRRYGADGQPG